MNKSLKVYVAGPYSADTQEKKLDNSIKAIQCALRLWKRGHFPYVPHLTHWVDKYRFDTIMNYEDWIAWSIPWLASSDAILVLGRSRGVDAEIKIAETFGIPVYYDELSLPEGEPPSQYQEIVERGEPDD